MRVLDRLHGGGWRVVPRLELLWILEPVSDGALVEGTKTDECVVLRGTVELNRYFLFSLLLFIQADGECAADGVGQALPRVPNCQEPVAHPSSGGSVSTDVAESLLIVAVRGTKRYLFNSLV